jgi:hypothetical protein
MIFLPDCMPAALIACQHVVCAPFCRYVVAVCITCHCVTSLLSLLDEYSISQTRGAEVVWPGVACCCCGLILVLFYWSCELRPKLVAGAACQLLYLCTLKAPDLCQ